MMSNTNENSNIRFHGVKDGEVFKIGDMEFVKFPAMNGETPVVMRNVAFNSRFGDNNDFRTSDVLEKMETEILPNIIKTVGEDNVCTIKTDLTALDGLTPYGVMESKISLPTLDFYRKNVAIFDKYPVGRWWWLATPASAQPHESPLWTLCVSPSGCVDFDSYGDFDGGVRPFCILKSSIFESSGE